MSGPSGSPVTGLQPCKRYIATHDKDGKSIYADPPEQDYIHQAETFGGMARSYAVDSIPANLTNDADLKAYRADTGRSSYRQPDIVVSPGANLVVVDLVPGAVTGMHRTVSIDFSICVLGEIEHELDGGEKVRLFPGDHIVQRGTMHRWSNPSDTLPARFVACTLPCIPFDIAGEKLAEFHHPPPPKREAKL